MFDGDDFDWEYWSPLRLFEERINHPRYISIREADKRQRQGDAWRAQQTYAQECKRCDKVTFEVCAAVHEAESHRSQGEWEKAIEDYRRAVECFRLNDQSHNVAIACLMLGLCYQAIANYREAVEQFTRAHTQFDALLQKHRAQGNRRQVGRYHALCEQALLLQAQANALGSVARGVLTQPTESLSARRGERTSAEEIPQRLSTLRVGENVVEYIPIFEQSLAAGSGVWLDVEDSRKGYLQMGGLQIEGKPYRLINLIDHSNHLRLNQSRQYGCVRVVGDSMNRGGIDPGDYVIVVRQSDFDSGNLVAVALDDDVERRGLIKQIKIERDLHTGAIQVVHLIPRSSNPMHHVHSFDLRQGDRLPDWIGRVIAVLKPSVAPE